MIARPDSGFAERLVVSNVILSDVLADGFWSVDDVGYNFRHEISGDEIQGRLEGCRVELRYVFTLAGNAKYVVRFDVKVA